MKKIQGFIAKNATIATFVGLGIALGGGTFAQKEWTNNQMAKIMSGELKGIIKPTQSLLTPQVYMPFSKENDIFSHAYRETGRLIIGEQTPIKTIIAGEVKTTLRIEGPENKHAEHFKINEMNTISEEELNSFLNELDKLIQNKNIQITSIGIRAKSDPTGLNDASLVGSDLMSLGLNKGLAESRTEDIISRIKGKRPELSNIISALPAVVSKLSHADMLQLSEIGKKYNLRTPSEALRNYKDGKLKISSSDDIFIRGLLDKSISVDISGNKVLEIGLGDPNMTIIAFLIFVLTYLMGIGGAAFHKYDKMR